MHGLVQQEVQNLEVAGKDWHQQEVGEGAWRTAETVDAGVEVAGSKQEVQ